MLKTAGPVAIVGALWLYPAACIALGKPHDKAVRDTAHVSLLFMELILPTCSKTIAQVRCSIQ